MLKAFYPKKIADSAYVIKYEQLYKQGYRGIIFDIDNTLVEHDADATPEAIELIAKVGKIGFQVCLISNNDKERVTRFNRDIQAHYIYDGKKPLKRSYLNAMNKMGTTIKTTVFVGDQLFTDVWGANRIGLMTYFVKPISPKETFFIILKRKLERLILHFYRKTSKNIILIGFMGSGKTTVGKYLADKKSYQFYDTDEMIEEKEAYSIRQIFKDKGEEYFRNLETRLLRRLSSSINKTVIATGGGMPLRKENQEILRDLGYVVYLKASPETIKERIGDDNSRPLLQKDFEESAKKLIKIRDPIYTKAAHKIINTDNKSIRKICKEIERGSYEDISN